MPSERLNRTARERHSTADADEGHDEPAAIELPTSVEPMAQRSPWAWAAPPEWNRDEDDEQPRPLLPPGSPLMTVAAVIVPEGVAEALADATGRACRASHRRCGLGRRCAAHRGGGRRPRRAAWRPLLEARRPCSWSRARRRASRPTCWGRRPRPSGGAGDQRRAAVARTHDLGGPGDGDVVDRGARSRARSRDATPSCRTGRLASAGAGDQRRPSSSVRRAAPSRMHSVGRRGRRDSSWVTPAPCWAARSISMPCPTTPDRPEPVGGPPPEWGAAAAEVPDPGHPTSKSRAPRSYFEATAAAA